jgi:hypothetical protein
MSLVLSDELDPSADGAELAAGAASVGIVKAASIELLPTLWAKV